MVLFKRWSSTNCSVNVANSDNSKSFKYKAESLGDTVTQPNLNQANEALQNVTITVSLKYFGNFCRSLEISLINCAVELKLK